MADGLDMVPVLTSGESAAAVAQQVASQRLADAQARITRTGELGSGVDPDYVQTFEHFDGMSHQAMYDGVHGATGLDPAGLQSARTEWHGAYSELVNASTFAKLGIARVFDSGALQGASSAAGQAAAELLLNAVQEMGRVVGSVTDRLDAASWAAEALRLAVGPPPGDVTLRPDPDNPAESVLPGLPNGEFVQTSDAAAEQERLAAAAVLNRTYKGEFLPQSAQVPAFIAAPDSASAGPAGAPNSAGAPNGSGGPQAGVPEVQSPEAPSTPDSGVPTESMPSLDTSAVTAAGTDLAQSLLAGTSPAGVTTAPSGTGAAPTLESPTTASRPSTPLGSGGIGGALGGMPNLQAGGSVPGSPTAGKAPVSGGVPGSAAGSGRGAGSGRPMGSGGSMAPGGAGRGKGKAEDDAERYSPEYLRRVDPEWTSSLPLVPVPVIGEDGVTRPDSSFTSSLDSLPPTPPPVVPPVSPQHAEPPPVPVADASPQVATQPEGTREAAPAAPAQTEDTDLGSASQSAEVDAEPVQVAVSESEPVTAARLAEIMRTAGGSSSVVLSGAGPAMADWEQTAPDDNTPPK